MPKISVIVPVYKVEPYLCRCVDSILAQTFTDFELILIDDGSPDNCGSICDEYAAEDSRVHVIHQENGGLSAARNAGIDWAFANSDSEWLTFIDSDDWVHSEYLNYLYQVAVCNHVLISMCMFEKKEDYVSESKISLLSVKKVTPTDAYTYSNSGIFAYAWGRLYRKSLFSEIRFPEGKVFEDLATTYKVLYRVQEIVVIQNALYYYYINREGIVLSTWTQQKLDQLLAYEEQIPYFKSIGDKVAMYQAIRGCIYSIHENYLRMHETEEDAQKKREYDKILRGKMKNLLRRHAKELEIRISEKPWLYEVAYPSFVRGYWLWKALLVKIGKQK